MHWASQKAKDLPLRGQRPHKGEEVPPLAPQGARLKGPISIKMLFFNVSEHNNTGHFLDRVLWTLDITYFIFSDYVKGRI